MSANTNFEEHRRLLCEQWEGNELAESQLAAAREAMVEEEKKAEEEKRRAEEEEER